MTKPLSIMISKNDGSEQWAKDMARIQFAMWVDKGAKCAECGRPYESVDDFIERKPRGGRRNGGDDFPSHFVDSACWDAYEAKA